MEVEMPNTLGYMIAGYVVLLGLPLVHVLSWWVRRRHLERDIELIQTITDDKKQ